MKISKLFAVVTRTVVYLVVMVLFAQMVLHVVNYQTVIMLVVHCQMRSVVVIIYIVVQKKQLVI